MINIVEKFLIKFDLNKPEKTFLVGFSGGCDSLCLLNILHELSQKHGFRLVALHLNHNWRGAESVRDELNCKDFCDKNAIEFVSETLPENHPKSESSAREARYDFFLKHSKKYENCSVFTAHSKSDNAETLIYRIVKGTGIKGLQGIMPARELGDNFVYRPLLEVSRNEIEGYCIAKELVANNDSSNFDVSYKRNFIRHEIMPRLHEINFSAENSIVSLSKIAQSQNRIVDEYLSLIKKDLYIDGKISTEKFRNLSCDVKQKIVYDLCLDEKLDYDFKKNINILNFINENVDSKSGSRFSLTSGLWLFASSKYIYVISKLNGVENKSEVLITKEGDYPIVDTSKVFSIRKYSSDDVFEFPSENALFAYINLDEVGFDLTLRTRRDGDFITPFGMSGKMKLKKYLNAKKISQHEKDELILLCKGSEVFWVAGVGLSNKLKVVNVPTHVIELKE